MEQRAKPYWQNTPSGESVSRFTQRSDDEIDLMEVVGLLLHNAWLIVLAALVGALAVGIGVKLFVPARYTAESTIYVFSTAGETNTQTLSQANQLTTDFQIIAKSRPTAEKVIRELGLDLTADQLKKANSIKVTNPTDSHMLCIAVTNRDPAEAARVSNALASVMCEQIAEIMKSERPQFVEPAVLGTKTSPYVRRDAMIAGIGCALLAIAFVLIRYFANDTITTEQDVNRYLGLTILSSVPFERNLSKRS